MEKYIHYCWFGDAKKSKLTQKCIKSWKKYFPDYKIIEWNEENFDVNSTEFSKKAYAEKKWAFVSDVARVYALKEMGGIYLDTDMLVTKKPDEEMLNSNFFVGWESDINIAVGVLGVKKGNEIINKLYKIYEQVEFDPNDLYRITIPRLLTDLLRDEYKMEDLYLENQILENNTHIYARDYFYPISSDKNQPDMFTDNTCMIHYYSGSWLPREEQLNGKFNQIFGRKLGKVILKILVLGKHALKNAKKILKKICIVIFYPLVKIRRIKYKKHLMNIKKQNIDESLDNINAEQVIFYHEEWLGIKNATKELFGDKAVGITELYDDEVIEYCAEKILNKNLKLIAFSGFADGWDKLIKQIRKTNKKIAIKIIWHGSICMNIYDYDYMSFIKVFELLENKDINSVALVKKSMYEFFKNKGCNVEFLRNNVILNDNLKETKKIQRNGKVNIGIYASGDRWIKNFYNQMAAASLVENCVVDCVPINNKAYELAKIFNLKIKGLTSTLEHEDLLKRMAQNDINLYVTFSECAPIIPLESLELGVPCITGNNHHYFDGNELQEYLIVDKPDDVNAIYEGIKKCLENKEKIIELYKSWKEENEVKSKESVEKFLETK